ncbi:MAG TPA: RDD family protein [Pseudonocardia sp.]
MARWVESWMPGTTVQPNGRTGGAYPGEQWGLPASGVGSMAGFGRRLAALTIDWFIGYGIAAIFATPDATVNPWFGWLVLGVWFLLTAVPVALFGATAGMTVLGIRVVPVDGRATAGVLRAVLRTALTALVVPALLRGVDGRAWHDRAARTVLVRSR